MNFIKNIGKYLSSFKIFEKIFEYIFKIKKKLTIYSNIVGRKFIALQL